MRETTLPAVRNNFRTPSFNKSGSKLLCLAALSLMSLTSIKAQHETDYKVHANIIYRFTKYIDWPADKKSGDFIIGIVGDSPLYDELKSLSVSKTVGSQKIVVVKMSPSANAYSCHMLFISDEESASIKRIAALTAGTAILIISESDGLARKGSCINFITVDERLKLEINKGNVEQRNLRIASELLELGIIIK
ncbi:YfiR family protein [Flavitalea sp. BT771]|uniref:YfiR family protein n=1 Tax=Flavitalea sp. BT771 TaxID=3063329 RepID=UPI0026E432AD|nr:YfiR family protein [Flavitalea sp. BT771]MDO6430844.1 YfiR family protein [Flavitalea sp. BT771]MDV6219016.1 YfiR family protein [Flavitalea sp. BT771]